MALWFLSWCGNGTRTHGRRRVTPPQEVRQRRVAEAASAESLECRRLFASVSLNTSTGVLTVTADSTNDLIEVYVIQGTENNNIYVKINDVTPPFGGYLESAVGHIDIYANQGNDQVIIETDTDNPEGDTGVNETTRVFCDEGADTVRGGDFADEIHGEMGSDILDGRGGHDTLHGGYGSDETLDTFGNDTLTGGSGNDVMYGGPGDDAFDLFDNVTGNDYADGQDGSDSVLNSDSGDTTLNM